MNTKNNTVMSGSGLTNHRSRVRIRAVTLGSAILFGISVPVLQAYPGSAVSRGNSCSVCHGPATADAPNAEGRKVSGVLSVSDFVRQANLGTQLDGKVRGALKTFDGVAGTTVTLSADVLSTAPLAANPTYALQLKRLEKSGQKNSLTNYLNWTDANPVGSGWVKYGTTAPYYPKILASGATGTFSFQLGLVDTTPVDFYDLEFAIAGVDDLGLFYADEHYYLAVVSPALLTDSAVTWSAALASAGWVLETATDPAGPWQAYTGPSAVIEGTNVVLMKTAEGGKKFFRLAKP